MNLNTLPDICHHDAQGYEIALCLYGHDRYWLAGGSRWQPIPPVQAGIWRCAVCCPPLGWVGEVKAVEEILPTFENQKG